MTLEQATQLKNDLNEQLEKAGNRNLTYSVYTFWSNAAEKLYNVILYPLVYKTKYEAANTSGQFSVVRVSIKTQSAGAQTDEAFINNFNANVANDPEANDLLNK
jgi:hypothetical protein